MKDTWKKIFSKPFTTKDGDNSILTMAEFGGELYVGTGRSASVTSANVFRLALDGCKKWEKVTPPWSSATGGYSMAMALFKNQLYVGTEQGEVWRTSDGENWSDAGSNLPSIGMIFAMAEFNGYLHMSAGTSIWRSSDGSSWKLVVDLSAKDSKIYDICSLEVFSNHLYAGIGLKNPVYVDRGALGKVLVNLKGIQLWRTQDGISWSKFEEVLEPTDGLGTQFYPEHVHALKAFNSYLYVGEYHGSGLYRTDGSATSWDYIPDAVSKGSGSVFRLTSHAGDFYLGASHLAPPDLPGVTGSPLLYSSADGTQWVPVQGSPELDNDHSSVSSLLSHGGRLYVGTDNPSNSGSVAVYELGPEVLADNYEPNNTFDEATPLKLGLTNAQTSVELADLTLHENDVDFFKIEFQSKLGQKCFSTFTQDLGSGLGVEIHPDFLSVLAQEEYCQALTIEIYDSKKKLKGKFQSTNEVSFECPTEVFEGQDLFVVVKNPSGEPVRYKLSVTYGNPWGRIVGKLLYKFWEVIPPPYPPPPVRELVDPRAKYFDLNKLVVDSEKYLPEFIETRGNIDKADLRHGLGRIAHLVGLYDDAERFYKQSLTAFQELRITGREADVLRNLGELYSTQGRMEEAMESYETASQLHQELKDYSSLAQDQMTLGVHYLARGEASKSLAALDEALRVQAGVSDWSGSVLNLLSQSEAFLALNQQEAAVACLALADQLSSRAGDSALRREVNQRVELVSAQIGEREFLELKKHLAKQEETVRQRAISKIATRPSSRNTRV